VQLTPRDPLLAVMGRGAEGDAVAPFVWCPEAAPASASFDARLQPLGYVRMHPQAPLFRRLERRPDDARRHVVMCTDDPESGGVAQYNHTLMLSLVEAGYRVTCVQSRADNPLVTAQREAGISHVWIDYHTGAEFARTLTDAGPAEAIFEGDRPDLVIFSNCCPLSQLAAREAARRRALPYLCVEGFVGAYLADTFAAHLPVLARQYAEARAIIAVSEENRALLLSRFGAPADRTQVVHYGRPERFFAPRHDATRARLRAELGLPRQAVVSLTTARLSAVKGFQHQLKALLQLKAGGRAKHLHLVWVGDGELRAKLEEAVAKAGLKDRVHFLGHRWDVADWYDAADLFVLTSHLEGMPLSIMEAMAKGLPVAATAVSGIPEELGDTGCLLPDPTQQPDATSAALARVLERWTVNPAERTAAGIRCRTRAEALFREGRMVERMLKIVAGHLAMPSSPLLQTVS
jgi:glycosyltransferase involved in cell wall biosynthesis